VLVACASACGGTKASTTQPAEAVTAAPTATSVDNANAVDGGIARVDPAMVQQVIHANGGHFHLCYMAALKKTKGLTGRVETKFVIDETGHVITAEDVTRSNVLQDDDARNCVVAKFRMLEFPPPQPSGKVTITYPLFFEPPPVDPTQDAGVEAGDDYAHVRKPFNAAAAAAALSAVDAKPCGQAGYHGVGHIKVTFDPSGVVTKTEIDQPATLPPAAKTCVAKAFAAARISVFEGSAVTVGKNFTVP
jgi:hypothetical protein